jgi:hypothetical protein
MLNHTMTSIVFNGFYNDVSYEIWQSDGEFIRAMTGGYPRWNYYVRPNSDESAEKAIFPNGGCTYDEIVAGRRKLGCDYAHSFNYGQEITLEQVEADLIATIESMTTDEG